MATPTPVASNTNGRITEGEISRFNPSSQGGGAIGGVWDTRREVRTERIKHLLIALRHDLGAIVLAVPLTERGGIDLHNAVLHKCVRADQLVVGGVILHGQQASLAGHTCTLYQEQYGERGGHNEQHHISDSNMRRCIRYQCGNSQQRSCQVH